MTSPQSEQVPFQHLHKGTENKPLPSPKGHNNICNNLFDWNPRFSGLLDTGLMALTSQALVLSSKLSIGFPGSKTWIEPAPGILELPALGLCSYSNFITQFL